MWATEVFPCSYLAVKAIERRHPSIKLVARANLDAQFILKPHNQESADLLQAVREIDGQIIPIEVLRAEQRLSKAIVLHYP